MSVRLLNDNSIHLGDENVGIFAVDAIENESVDMYVRRNSWVRTPV